MHALKAYDRPTLDIMSGKLYALTALPREKSPLPPSIGVLLDPTAAEDLLGKR